MNWYVEMWEWALDGFGGFLLVATGHAVLLGGVARGLGWSRTGDKT
jgi:hypothetical protein